MTPIRYLYLKTTKEAKEYHGERYFKFTYGHDYVIQICKSNGKQFRRGKANTIGVYFISRLTLVSNYIAMDNVEPCTKRMFDKKFNEVIQWLN